MMGEWEKNCQPGAHYSYADNGGRGRAYRIGALLRQGVNWLSFWRRYPILRRSQPYLMLALIMLAGAFLRFFHLDHLSFWRDEGSTVAIASMPWDHFLDLMGYREINMSLYYLIIRGWMALGSSELVLRAFSALCSLATIPIVYLLGRRLFSRWVGLAAAMLFAVNLMAIQNAQEARAYTLGPLLTSLSWLCLVSYLQDRKWRDWAGWVVTAGASAYAQCFAMLMLPAALLPLIITLRWRAPWKMLATGTAIIGLIYLPFAALVFHEDAGQLAWIPPASLRTVGSLIFHIMGGFRSEFTGAIMCLGFTVAFGLALVAMVRAWNAAPEGAMPWALMVGGVVVPVAAVLLVSIVRSVLIPRYLTVITPTIVLLASAGLGTINRRVVRGSAFAALLLLCLTQVVPYFLYATKTDYRDGTEYVVKNSLPGDVLVIANTNDKFAYDYYRARLAPHDSVPQVIYPVWDGIFRIDGCYFQDSACKSSRRASWRDAIARAIAERRRVWLVSESGRDLTFGTLTLTEIERPLVQAYGELHCQDFAQISICLAEPSKTKLGAKLDTAFHVLPDGTALRVSRAERPRE